MGIITTIKPSALELLEGRHERLAEIATFLLPDAMTISIMAINGLKSGQLILASDEYSRAVVSERLRLCADILEGTI